MLPSIRRLARGALHLCLLFPLLAGAQAPSPTPADWARFRAMQQADASGEVRPDGLLRALERRRDMLQASGSAGLAPGAAPAAGISTAFWTPLGPGNLGGRVTAIATHPTQPNTVWIGSASGGIWKSTDGGGSWLPASDFMGSLSINSLVISPSDPNVMYAATGEPFYIPGALPGAGLFKSTDGGATWNALAATNPALDPRWAYITRIAIHPTNGNILLAVNGDGIYRTADGGFNWSRWSDGARGFDGIVFDPLDGNKALALGETSIAYTTDGGVSWTPTNFGAFGRSVVAYSRQPGVVYASVNTNPNGNSGTIYRSDNGGTNWIEKANLLHLGTQGERSNAIWVDPTNANHLIVGGVDLHRSTDGGVTWTRISNGTQATSVASGHHAIAAPAQYNGASNRTIYFANDGGIYKAVDIQAVTATNTGWTRLNNGLAITQFLGGAGHGGPNGRITGGARGTGSLVYGGTGTNWSVSLGGDAGASAIDPTDGNYIYGEGPWLRLQRSTNGGATWTQIADAGPQSANVVAPFVLDPNNPNTMFAGGTHLWRSTNVKAAVPAWSSFGTPSGYAPNNISRIAVAKGNSNVVWLGRNYGEVAKSVDAMAATPTFTDVTGYLPRRMVLSILIDKDRHNTVYVGLGGFLSDNLWRTTDGGATWRNIGAGLPAAPIRAIERHAAQANYLYVGTDVGLFTSEDGGATWNANPDGPASVPVEHLFWYDASTLVAATHGRGMFKTTVAVTRYALTVSKSGTGSGTVTSSTGGINCGAACTASLVSGSTVTLSVVPAAGSVFGGWSGACIGTAPCTVSMTAARAAVATFHPAASSYALTIGKAGTGSGPVTSNPAGLTCGSTCTANFAPGTVVYLTATANANSVFTGWSGACSGTVPSCAVKMDFAQTVTATFSATRTLTINKVGGGGSWWVVSSPSGIGCGTTCSAGFALGSTVTLSLSPEYGATFTGWSGACAGTGLACVVSMDAAKSVTANFASSFGYGNILRLQKSGAGAGRVTSSPAAIDCGPVCAGSFPGGPVTLTATAAPGSVFAGWTGHCTGGGTCTLNVGAAAKDVTAVFNLVPVIQYAVTVSKAGTGSGPVTSSPAGITCGSTCRAAFGSGTVVTLTATPNAGSIFTGWSGACSGTSATCTLDINKAKDVTASYSAGNALTITKAGSGSGPVTSSPAGISCGSVCSANFASGTVVTLTAKANASSTFTGWSGACSGASTTCTVSMDAARSVTATFQPGYALSVSLAGAGLGSVSSSPGGIACGPTCSASFPPGSSVTLTASPDPLSVFTGWTGACGGTAQTCMVSMTQLRSATATFAPLFGAAR